MKRKVRRKNLIKVIINKIIKLIEIIKLLTKKKRIKNNWEESVNRKKRQTKNNIKEMKCRRNLRV